MRKRRTARRLHRLSLLPVALASVFIGSCKPEVDTLYDPSDPESVDKQMNLKRKDYANLLKTAEDPTVTLKTRTPDGPPIPDMAPILAAPTAPKIGQTKLVSVTVTDDVPLKDVLIELARLADVDIEVDASITGGISFRAKDRPFNEVIERIANLAGLRYKMANGVLRVERDTPYILMYPIDFINIERSASSSVNISTNVLSDSGGSSSSGKSSGGGGGGGLNTGSTSSITASSNSDFWKQFEEGLRQILSYKPASKLSSGSGAAAGAAAGGAPATPPPEEKTFYILNRQGSTLTVNASQRQQELVKQFIQQMQINATSQVLIEAKIVEVELSREFQSGIDWNRIATDQLSFKSNFGGVDSTKLATFNFVRDGTNTLNVDLDLAVRLAETFGTTRTLSSPRLHAINNQQAVLTFAQNQVYFQVTVDRETTTSTAQTSTLTVNSEIKTVPIGIILTLQPSINLETSEVTLNVRPTLSRVTGFVSDPAVAYLVSQAQADGADLSVDSAVPVVEVRELDSILKLKSGQVMVIGGLMEDRSVQTNSGLPYAKDVPVLGELFKGTDRETSASELVIFIRATIIHSGADSIPTADKAIYKKFMQDPRPLDF